MGLSAAFVLGSTAICLYLAGSPEGTIDEVCYVNGAEPRYPRIRGTRLATNALISSHIDRCQLEAVG